MNRRFNLCHLAAVLCVASPAFAQSGARVYPAAALAQASVPQASVHGVVLDDRGEPVAGAIVSALGSTSAFAVSDQDGRFALRNLPFGPYLMRAHLQGYLSPRARLVQVDRASLTLSSIALARRAADSDEVQVLSAGVGGTETSGTTGIEGEGTDTHDHGEVAWRLRHLKRSVLKDATRFIDGAFDEDSLLGDSLLGLGWAVGTSARAASSFLADVPWNGHVDFLTSTSFNRPQDLWSTPGWPRGVAFLTLEAPMTGGQWTMRGAVTQSDLASWILAGSYRRDPAAHRYDAGVSYGMQRYVGAGSDTRAIFDGGRTVGAVYASDAWTITPRLVVNYGAKYAHYDYLAQQGLLSPHASVTIAPTSDDTFKVRTAVSHHAIAPGADEFIPQTTAWLLPPERTFSPVSPGGDLTSERVDHLEIAVEREWAGGVVIGIRGFQQHVDNQLVTLFGVGLPGAAARLNHYYVASAGDVDSRGWGLSASRTVAARLHASVDYTQVRSTWRGQSADAAMLLLLPIAVPGGGDDRLHDVTMSVDTTLPATATQVFLIYKVNSLLDDTNASAARLGTRFDLQLKQALPFLAMAGAEWEMLVAIRSLFREELLDTSAYDELLVVRPPTRVVGGVTVRF